MLFLLPRPLLLSYLCGGGFAGVPIRVCLTVFDRAAMRCPLYCGCSCCFLQCERRTGTSVFFFASTTAATSSSADRGLLRGPILFLEDRMSLFFCEGRGFFNSEGNRWVFSSNFELLFWKRGRDREMGKDFHTFCRRLKGKELQREASGKEGVRC